MHKAHIKGSYVRELRAQKLITQQQLADLAGVRVETLCRLELGQRPAHFKTIHKIAEALDVPAIDITERESA